MSQPRLVCFLVAVSAVATVMPRAHAQTASGFALDRFDPSERGSDWFSVESLDLRGRLRPAFGVVLDWARKPLVIYDLNDEERAAVVENQMFLHVGGALVIADRLRLGVNLPIAVYQTGETGSIDGLRFDAPDGAAVGDLRVSADVRLFGRYGGPLTVAIGGSFFLPTGDQAQWTGDESVHGIPRVLLAGGIGPLVYAAKAGVHFRPSGDGGVRIGNELLVGGAAGLRLADGRLILGPEVLAATSIREGDDFLKQRTTPVELILGAHAALGGGVRLAVGLSPGLSQGIGSPQFRVLSALEWFPAASAPDTDGDGISDGLDACPREPGPRTADPATNGCPPPPDRDNDGIVDGQDACPDEAGVRTDDRATNGCPPPRDTDADGVVDPQDACPTVPGPRTEDPATNGCPPPDRDKDGVADPQDACPDVPGVKTDDPMTNGCPGDRDKDGVPDNEDACPDQAGARDPDPKKSGCPVARVEAEQIKIREQVKFKTASSRILPESDPIITAVADLLKQHAEIASVRVEGHTDSVGADAYNKRLSASRAAAVVNALAKKGIDKKRLKSVGHGEEKPIESNDTDEGRRNNRRVEFHIEEQKK